MKLTKAQELQVSLKPGDIIIATDIHYFDFDEDVKKKNLYSQKEGDLLMVNNPGVYRNDKGEIYTLSDIVGGTRLNGINYAGRPCVGLSGSFRVGKFRLATPEDRGYMATLEEFKIFNAQKVKELKMSSHFDRAILVTSAIMFIWLIGVIL